jgi:hypothetical protein
VVCSAGARGGLLLSSRALRITDQRLCESFCHRVLSIATLVTNGTDI